jgi:hypothetical protein
MPGLAMAIMIAIRANMMPYSTIVVPLTLYFFMCSPFDRRHFFRPPAHAEKGFWLGRMEFGFHVDEFSVRKNILTGIEGGGETIFRPP